MTRNDFFSLLLRIIDCDFTVNVYIGAEMMDCNEFTLEPVKVNTPIRAGRYFNGFFAGHKMYIDPNMKMFDYRIIKLDGSIVDLRDHGIEYYFNPTKRIRNEKIDKITKE